MNPHVKNVSHRLIEDMAPTNKKLASTPDAVLRAHLAKIGAKGGASRSAKKIAACKLNMERLNAARRARKA